MPPIIQKVTWSVRRAQDDVDFLTAVPKKDETKGFFFLIGIPKRIRFNSAVWPPNNASAFFACPSIQLHVDQKQEKQPKVEE
jgi:hypothetical protein